MPTITNGIIFAFLLSTSLFSNKSILSVTTTSSLVSFCDFLVFVDLTLATLTVFFLKYNTLNKV